MQATTTPPAPPASTAAPAAPQAQTPQVVSNGQILNDPRAVYLALQAQRDELRDQRNELASDRYSIAERLREGNAAKGADLAGLEARITQMDATILAVEKQLAEADLAVARAAGVPGAAIEPPPFAAQEIREMAEAGATMLFVLAVLMPISIAIARRLWRRASRSVAGIPNDLSDRLSRIEEAVDTMAVEVERIGEGQRFVTHLFVENGPPMALGAGAMEPVEVRDRERVRRE